MQATHPTMTHDFPPPPEPLSHQQSHLHTYTAGEDGSRLAEMAKQFGLEKQRQPRKQVRDETTRRRSLFTTRQRVQHYIQDHSIEAARMRAAYSRQRRDLHLQDVGVLTGAAGGRSLDMPEWLEAIEFEEEDLHAQGVGGDLTSAVLGIIKGMVGPAILFLPHGMAASGYALAIPIMLLVTFLFSFSCQCLLDSWRLEHTRLLRQVELKEAKANNPNFIEEGNEDEEEDESSSLLSKADQELHHQKRTFFLSYPELAYKALGYQFEQLVKLGITLMQSCVCLTYLIFVPQNFSTAVHRLCGILVAPEWFLIIMILVQVPMSWIRDIRKLTVTNLLANVLILYGLITCIVLVIKQATSDITSFPTEDASSSPFAIIRDRFKHLAPVGKDWFPFIGTSVFMFEGSITVLVPLQEAVFSEEDREKFPAVNRNTILCIIAFYILFSVTCWMALGNDVRTVLTTSLPAGATATTVQLAYSVAVIFTFPLQNYPALEIACRSVANALDYCGSCQFNPTVQHNIISSVLVLLLALVAATTMESLDKVVSFLGGLLGCPIAFIFPPLIHLQLAAKSGTLSQGRKIMDILVALMGFVAMILSTITTLIGS